ncbi:uncharacterized protein LOC133831206 isoform X3 [Humulus lupulus]|uniref:uncharacterized protein LOC133831206 isoform X3 n=1 Tax=Humulus lupulus TaxID=3486 RepID=UPI002B40772E|nr:uncharacterized protein LOC133831206 isoform X3 [Humulus lupulus]
MAKKRVAPDRKKALKKIDNIPKCSQQPRSSPPKRRTDFSSFFCKSISLFNSEGKELFPSSIVRCSKSQEEGSGFSSNSTEASFLEVELVGQDALLESSDSREVGKDGSDASPVSVAWAKSHKMWWSAEDMLQKEHHILSSELIKRSAASNHSDEQDFSSGSSGNNILTLPPCILICNTENFQGCSCMLLPSFLVFLTDVSVALTLVLFLNTFFLDELALFIGEATNIVFS